MCYLKVSIFYVYRDNLDFLILIEGICQRELKLLFKHIHQQKFSNLLSLASMIRNFQYGSKESSPSNTFNLSSEDNEMSFLLTGLVQFGDETEMVDIYVGSSLADVHAQLVAPFDLDPNQCIIQDNLRELPPLPLSHMLPSFPIQIKSAVASGNDLLIRKLSRRIRDLRSQIKRNSYKRPRFLDWDSNRYTENVSQTDSPVIDPTTIADSSQLKEFITKLNDAFDNNQMTRGTTTQIIVESFRLCRCYLQFGQSTQKILNKMRFSQHIAFIKLEFELITKVSLLVATQRIRKFLDNIISYEMYGQLPNDHVCTTSIKPGTI
ncbi:unnamed protein product [Rotaria sp. Silwood2]|nr:unnamed protein product [Rotaria sp. Silwood2]